MNCCLRCDPTARAIAYVIAQWIAAGIDRDSEEEVLRVMGVRDGYAKAAE